jgi:acyl-CoA hydrolase
LSTSRLARGDRTRAASDILASPCRSHTVTHSHRPPAYPSVPPIAQTPSQSRSRLHQLMMPEHANMLGTVHGGEIMKLVDEVAAICAMRHAQHTCVTLSVDSMTFRSPVHVGEVIQLDACVNYVGRTSMEIGVEVLAEDPIRGVVTHTNSANLVFVAISEDGTPVEVPGLVPETDEERARFQAGELRQRERKRHN